MMSFRGSDGRQYLTVLRVRDHVALWDPAEHGWSFIERNIHTIIVPQPNGPSKKYPGPVYTELWVRSD